MIRSLTFALGLGCALALPANALDIGAMSEEERQIFRDEVRAYLLENPEVIMEAVAVLEEREAEAQARADVDLVAAYETELFNDGHSWQGGNLEGDITLVEFIDYRCGYCRRAHPEVSELVATDGNIRLIVKEFPILGEQSTLSSRFAIATQQVAGEDAYKAVHEALIAFDGEISEVSLRRLGGGLGFDADAIMAQMDSPDVNAVIAENHQLARALGISGTPTFVMEDRLLRGYVPLAGMQQLADEIRSQ